MLLLLAVISTQVVWAGNADSEPQSQVFRPTHADAAIILSKFSGLFDRYIPEDATLNDCVAFLNKAGIYFGLMEVLNGSEFTVHDSARVMGQMNLLFAGEARFLAGKVRLPSGIASWEDFCMLNDVKYVEGYENLRATARVLHDLAQ